MNPSKLKRIAVACLITLGVVGVAAPATYAASSTSLMGFFAVTCPAGQTLQADQHTCCPPGTNGADSCLFSKYINPLIQLLSAAVGVVVVIAVVVGAIEYATSAGDPSKAATGKKHIMNALFGLLAYVMLYAFLQFLIPGGLLHG